MTWARLPTANCAERRVQEDPLRTTFLRAACAALRAFIARMKYWNSVFSGFQNTEIQEFQDFQNTEIQDFQNYRSYADKTHSRSQYVQDFENIEIQDFQDY